MFSLKFNLLVFFFCSSLRLKGLNPLPNCALSGPFNGHLTFSFSRCITTLLRCLVPSEPKYTLRSPASHVLTFSRSYSLTILLLTLSLSHSLNTLRKLIKNQCLCLNHKLGTFHWIAKTQWCFPVIVLGWVLRYLPDVAVIYPAR